mgnify:CR=1 FL=1
MKLLKQNFRHHCIQNGIAKKFQSLVVFDLIRIAGVGH